MSMSEKKKLQKENRQELWIACRFGLGGGAFLCLAILFSQDFNELVGSKGLIGLIYWLFGAKGTIIICSFLGMSCLFLFVKGTIDYLRERDELRNN